MTVKAVLPLLHFFRCFTREELGVIISLCDDLHVGDGIRPAIFDPGHHVTAETAFIEVTGRRPDVHPLFEC